VADRGWKGAARNVRRATIWLTAALGLTALFPVAGVVLAIHESASPNPDFTPAAMCFLMLLSTISAASLAWGSRRKHQKIDRAARIAVGSFPTDSTA